MEALFEAVKKGDSNTIDNLACEYFIKSDGRCDWENIFAFEKQYPGTKVVPLEEGSFGWLIGGIKYEGKTYSYG